MAHIQKQIVVPEELHSRLKTLSRKEARPMSGILRLMIEARERQHERIEARRQSEIDTSPVQPL